MGGRTVVSQRRDAVALGAGYYVLGVPIGGLGVAWPAMQRSFGSSAAALGVILALFWVSYAVAAAGAGRVLAHHRRPLSVAGGVGAIGLVLTSVAPGVPWCSGALVVVGVACGLLDATLNTEAARGHAVRRLNLLHALFAAGATSGPLVFAALMAARWSWRAGFVIVAGAFAMFAAVAGPRSDGSPVEEMTDRSAVDDRPLRRLVVPVSVAIALVYVGCEVIAGQWSPTLLTGARGLSMSAAGVATAIFWASFAGGRLLIALAGGSWSPDRVLAVASTGAIAGAIVVLSPVAAGAVPGLALAGAAMGPLFPTLIALTSARFGAQAATIIGWQVSASAAGGGLAPVAVGLAVRRSGPQSIAIIFVLGLAVVWALLLAQRHSGPVPT